MTTRTEECPVCKNYEGDDCPVCKGTHEIVWTNPWDDHQADRMQTEANQISL